MNAPSLQISLSPDFIRRAGARMFALGMRFVPRSKRMGLALSLAKLSLRLEKVFRRAVTKHRIDGPVEMRLARMLELLTRYGCPFDLSMRVEGERVIDEAIATGSSVMFVGFHSMLSTLIVRYGYDRRLPLLALAAKPFLVPGTTLPAITMRPRPGCLIRVRGILRRRGAVAAMIDRRPGGDNLEFTTESGPLGVTDTLLRLAARVQTQVVFFGTRIERDGIVMRLVAAPRKAADANQLLDQFIRFTREYVNARSID